MSSVHVWLAWSAAGGVACLVVASVLLATGATKTKRWLDRAILLQGATAIGASAPGLVLLVTGHPVTDPLHFVYAVVLLLLPVATRYVVRNDAPRRVGRALTLASAIAAGVVIRAFMTGG
jgi:hypothetical protein